MPGALSGLRVIEAGEGVAIAMAGRWLAAFGAEVVKVESPAGDPSRRYNPIGAAPEAAAATGSLHRFLDAGKKSAVLDLETPTGCDALFRLLANADVVLRDGPLEGVTLPADGAVVDVLLTDFPEQGPYADFAGSTNVLLALGGYQYLTGDPGRPPLAIPGFQPAYLNGVFGVVAALAGLHARGHGRTTGRFSVSTLETLASLHQLTFSLYLQTSTVRTRHGNRWQGLYTTMLPCADGWIALAASGVEAWERLCIMLDRLDLMTDERFDTPPKRLANSHLLDEVLIAELSKYDKRQLFHRAQEEFRAGWGELLTFAEALDDPQHAARGFWVKPDGRTKVPGFPARMGETPWEVRAAPGLGEHTQEVLAGLDEIGDAVRSPAPLPGISPGVEMTAPDPTLPLAGMRVLDFTRVWAGPLCARILADLGAEVVRIERPVPPAVAREPPSPAGGLVELQRNKRSLAVDLDTNAGKALVRELVKTADVLVENFSSRVMPNFGMIFEALRELNPSLVMLSMPAYGAGGPYGAYVGAGPSIEPVTGLPNLIGYSEAEVRTTSLAYPDAVAGLSGAALVLIALTHAGRTGQGQWIDLSQMEATTAMLGEYHLAFQETGGLAPERAPNRHPEWAPHGTYRCAGEDEWVSVAVRSEADWLALCGVVGLAGLAAQPALATAVGRMAARDRIDAAIGAWTQGRTKYEAMSALQAAGVPAGAVLSGRDILEDPQFQHAGFFVRAGGRNREPDLVPASPILVDGRRRDDWLASPRVGEDSAQLLRELLSLTDERIEELVAQRVVVTL